MTCLNPGEPPGVHAPGVVEEEHRIHGIEPQNLHVVDVEVIEIDGRIGRICEAQQNRL